MLHPDLLKILCCPETRQPLALADAALIEQINAQIQRAQLRNRAGQPLTERLDGGLLRQDGKFLYPIREEIPVMLVDHAIPLPG